MSNALELRKQLIRVAKEANRPSQEILQYYAMERFLYRLSVSITATDLFSKAAYFSQLGVSMIFE